MRQVRLAGLLALVLVATALALPAAALAHAQLESTSPERGAVAKEEPDAVLFRFDEPVEGNLGAIRVYDANGQRVDEGDAFHPGDHGSEIGVDLKPGLADGSYTATYRLVSADGHVISSGFVFSVGKPGKAPAQTVAELTGRVGTGPVTDAVFGIARGLQYAAIALALGAVFFALAIWLPLLAGFGAGDRWVSAARSFAARLRWLLLAAALAGALSAAAAIVLEGAEAAGISGFSALKESIVGETLGTRFGSAWGLAFIAWLAIGAIALALSWARRSGRERLALGLTALPAAFLAFVPALGGHTGVQSPVVLLLPANVLHVAAMAIWLGGLATLLLAVPRGSRELEPPDRSRLLAALLARFSQIALAAVAVILLTGLIQTYVFVRYPGDLLDNGYGRAVLIKFLLLLGVIALGAYNRRRSVPRLRRIAAGGEAPGRAGLLLRRTLRAEVALLVVVIGVTAALASYAPPINAQAGPYSAEESVGPVLMELTVEPAQVGPNELHVYLFDAKSGAPFTRAKELRVGAALPEEQIALPLEPQVAGPGHYVIPGALLSAEGTWEVELAARVSAFDEYSERFEVPIG